MPWNDNANPGPWGSPPSGDDDGRDNRPPRRPTGGPRGPRRPDGGPDFSAQFDRINERLRRFFGGPGGDGVRPGAVAAVAGIAFALWAVSGFYVVQPHEQAVVTTFGRFSRVELPGLRYHLPAPIERVEKVGVTNLNQSMVGGSNRGDLPEESLMLTGDENIVDLDFAVTWRVSEADKFVFNVRDQDAAVKAVAESAMREVVGKTPLTDILTTGRGRVQAQAAELMQRTLDYWNSGVTVVEVQIRSANPPAEVVAAFREVATAGQDAESAINEANTYRNRVVNEAKGDASRIVQAAQAYREQSVREALGDAARFNQIYNEYSRAPGVTRERLYIETMQRVLEKSNKVVIDSQGASAPIILPPDVFRPRAGTAATAPAAPVQQQAAPAAAEQGAQR
ncbi:MAG: FtsH protease activity modulator HflK [Phenylobacterium sp.]|jgi:membrane protease subunit HflK|uniref:FtsH protease activity modulator HflK n=1 Tax=Phenylobacterium sp. TaxID=1871053 RepID=UPI002A3614F2|nr:FtsH protease activity modulator HflK [Phenylobacterium sp.]MDX9997732.1 FtsH protease activity modulator HflK [Phenylobacterium sp.]